MRHFDQSTVRAVHVGFAKILESAFDPKSAHSFADRPPIENVPLYITHRDESWTQVGLGLI